MAATHGAIGSFDGSQEDWLSYVARLQNYFIANDITDDKDKEAAKRRAILLSICGVSTYRLIKSLCAPAKPEEVPFKDLVTLVERHHNPEPSATVQRFKFHSRCRQPGETVSTYIAELRRIAEHCKFDNLESMLCDRLVCGIQDPRIQRRLLAESKLTFKQAFELAQAMESADRDAKTLLNNSSTPVHTVQTQQQQQQARRPSPRADQLCYRCKGKHSSKTCRFKDVECRNCKKKGHIARACMSQPRPQQRSQQNRQQTHLVKEAEDSDVDTDPAYPLFNVTHTSARPLLVTVELNQFPIDMEVDTGASVSLISKDTYDKLWPKSDTAPPIKESNVLLQTYTGEHLDTVGSISVDVCYKEQSVHLPLTVVAGGGPSLFGRDWLQHIRLDWKTLNHVGTSPTLEGLLDRHKALFRDELGTVKGTSAKLHVDPQSRPRFYKPRPVPYAMRERIEQEIDRLKQEGVIRPVEFSDWAAPIVPVLKSDGSVRLCGDYKLTVNQAAKVDTYPLPRIEDLLASLAGGKSFSKLDLAHAYQQIELEEESRKYVTVNTHKGLFQYNRLPFGVASAPAVFQRTMENLLQGLNNVCIYLDDILVTGSSERDHLENLAAVLEKLEGAGVRLKRSKCHFMLPSVEYLGHIISNKGIQPTEEKIRAIVKAPAPNNVTQLKAFLGMLNYYGKFLPNLSSRLAPLYKLLQKRVSWSWSDEQQQAFQEAKDALTSAKVLMHYDPSKKLILSCDASPYGVGAVLSHKLDDGTEHPVAFASRSLSPAEKKYAQLDKEGLAIVFGVRHFHHYLLGRRFTIFSDHKPLQYLFSESKAIPTMASARIQRWALTLSAYDYDIAFKPGAQHANADVLSRLPLPDHPPSVPLPQETVFLMETLQMSPVTAKQIKFWTSHDPILSKVRDRVLQGWVDTSDPKLLPYQRRKNELSIEDGCILWGNRVVVPPPGQAKVMDTLHEGHPGMARMKSLARCYVWWPSMDQELEQKVKECVHCQLMQNSPPQVPTHPWEWPQHPWARLHIDYAGPFMGKMFLVTVDAHSKWLEAHVVETPTSAGTIRKLRYMFATHGIPETIVTDNGSVFTSKEFQQFTDLNGIKHLTTAPYHPASNGLAERAVQTLKTGLKKMTTGNIEDNLARFLFQYRITPHTTTGRSPAELLMGRRPRSQLDILRPNSSDRVLTKQEKQKEGHDRGTVQRSFIVGDAVWVRNFSQGPCWLAGEVVDHKGQCALIIKLTDNRIVHRHLDHVRQRLGNTIPDVDTTTTGGDDPLMAPTSPNSSQEPSRDREQLSPPAPLPRRSARVRKPPNRFTS